MIERYSREEIKKIWQDQNRYKIWLEIELAAAQAMEKFKIIPKGVYKKVKSKSKICLLYTSPSPRDRTRSRMPSSA